MPSWIAACGVDDVDPEDVIPFEHDGQDYAIYRSPGDKYYATNGHCTHEKTLLCDGLVMGRVIECPKHNGRFDYVSGNALGAPVLEDVRTYPVKVTDGTVFIEIGLGPGPRVRLGCGTSAAAWASPQAARPGRCAPYLWSSAMYSSMSAARSATV